jgi:large subunit ribosomal protein L14e
MMEIGLICVKIAGRDSRKKCVIVDIIDEKYVLIDGETRRRKCNTIHLEPLGKKIHISKGADSKEVIEAFKELGIEIKESNKKEATIRPRKVRKSAEKIKPEQIKEKKAKKAEKPVAKKKDSKTEAKPKVAKKVAKKE